ncbi:hypothetical protein J7E87_29190 [Streptomyces sp. ISL-1]|uniref:hypothetical protein n=1 Tax=Streptomyces sp. ISL-1 TaxID=2817657 RepID=UPI001BE96DB1|nr:hypothetical protein [Streptomyces sp. ISL-1]MBT2393385.1 hypothetical protein [Streptomyces sp. ISL-1]
MAALLADAEGGQPLAGTGRVTLSRTGGGGFGAYALLYTTRLVPGGGVEAIIAAARPEDTDPAWGLQHPWPCGPQASETRPLMRWAAALDEQLKADSAADYRVRLAVDLVRIGHNTRIIPPPGSVDLPLAAWEMTTEHHIELVSRKWPAGYAGHTAARIGRLVAVAAKEE